LSKLPTTSGKDPLDVRLLNMYKDPAISGNPATMITQYGQTIEDWVGDKVIDQVAAEAKYRERRASVNAFNQANKRRKRGLALVPLKFGISFTATMLNQGGALLNIYMDGSVSVQPWRHRNGPGPQHQDGTSVRRWFGH
jgi:xanthine dehydrogenase large subunit